MECNPEIQIKCIMSSFRVDINNSEMVAYTNKLEKLHKSALPLAIRGTLNDMAFAMKKTELEKVTRGTFEERQKNFFKANSRVEAATGFNVKRMVSEIGMVSSGLHSPSTNYAVKDLEQQEEGGTIKGRSFKPLPAARKNGSGNVRPNSRISQILRSGNIVDLRDSKGAEWSQRAIRSAVHAGVGGFVLAASSKGGVLWRIKSIKRIGRDTVFTKEKLFSFKKSGVAKVRSTHFMRTAAENTVKMVEAVYKIQAEKQIRRLLNK